MSGTLRHIAKHSAIYAAGDILAKIVGFILLPLYTRKFSPEQYGILALILILNTFPSRFITQGINTWTLKAITLDYADDPRRRRIALSTSYYYLILSAVVVNLLLFLSIPVLAGWLLKSRAYDHLQVCTFITSILQTTQMIPLNVILRSKFRSVLYSTLSFSQFLASVSLNIFFIVGLNSGIAGIVYTDLIVTAGMAVVSFFIIRPELVPVFSRNEVGNMIRYGWPLLPARISMWLLDFADRFQLQRLSTTVEVGLYAAGAKYASVFQFLYLSQFEKVWPSVFFPLSKEKGAEQQFARLFTYLFLAACSLGIAVIVAVGPVSRIMLEERYWRSSGVVVWLVAGFILESCYQVFTIGIRIANQTRHMPLIVGAGALFNVTLNLWVLPRWGMVGAGFTTFLANAVLVVLGYRYSNRYYPVPYEWGRLGRIAAVFACIACLDQMVALPGMVAGVAFKVCELLAFCFALWAVGILGRYEMQTLREAVAGLLRRAGAVLGLQ